MRCGWGVVAAALVGLAGCATRRSEMPRPTGPSQVGVASWYGPGFHGRRTANGEVFDQHELTAAHPNLPLGTRVVVTNLHNRRSVEVRVNDRGPFVGDRVLDLSYAAARALDMIGPGTAEVRIEVLEHAPQVAAARSVPVAVAPPEAGQLPRVAYAVQVAAFSDAAKAEHLRRVIATRFPDAYVSPVGDEHHRVRIGPYPYRSVATSRATIITRLGYPAIVVEEP
jgi:rare lipoprotein A